MKYTRDLKMILSVVLSITLLSTNVSADALSKDISPEKGAQIDSNMIFSRLGKAPKAPAFEQEGYWVWGSSVIKADDDKYHMYVTRWPQYLTFHPGWMISSEIVHAVSDSPEGPYTYSDVVTPARGAQYWDGRSTHNPKIVKHGDTYILYYMGSTNPFPDYNAEKQTKIPLTPKFPEAIVARSNKRVGIATSKSPYGPWTRYDKAILETKPDTFYSFLTSNPSPWIHDDGSVTLMFKARSYNEQAPYHSQMSIGVAKAKHFMGPYEVVTPEPVFGYGAKNRGGNESTEIEDPVIWADKNGFHMLAKDQKGKLTGQWHSGLLAHSKDGIDWQLDAQPLAYNLEIQWQDGTKQKMGQLERASVLLDENNQVTHLFFGTMDGKGGFDGGKKSWNMVLPLEK